MGNEADFLGFFAENRFLIEALTLPFEPFRFWLRIRGDIRNRKTTPRLGDSLTQRLSVYAKPPENPPHCYVPLIANIFTQRSFQFN
jgi:hypothetical protein